MEEGEKEEITYGEQDGLYVSDYNQDHVWVQTPEGEGGLFKKEDVQEYQGDIAKLYQDKF